MQPTTLSPTRNEVTTTPPTTATTVTPTGESQRVYWQQWLSNNETSTGSRREWITSSVAVRMAPEAKAVDVTNLLRESLKLVNNNNNSNSETATSSTSSASSNTKGDALILVGTLFSLNNYVQYQHEPRDSSGNPSSRTSGLVRAASPSVQSTSTTIIHRAAANAAAAAASSPRSTSPISSHLRTKTTASTTTSTASTTSRTIHSEPIHLVHTLHPNDSPLDIRQRMTQRIKEMEHEAATRGRNIMAPQIQWYFIPALPNATTSSDNHSLPNASIPNCLQLEGYSTSMEDEEEDDDNENDSDKDCNEDQYGIGYDDDGRCGPGPANQEERSEQEQMEERFPWLKTRHGNTSHHCHNSNTVDESAHQRQRRVQSKLSRERKRAHEMMACRTSPTQQNQLSGFLLKRCHRDRHVWRRVHCLLTNDYLWFLSRLYTTQSRRTTSDNNDDYRYCRHGRVRLTQALLLEPALEYAPLYRTPYAFELVTPDGTLHAFRATSKPLQQQWIRVLKERIVQSYENSLMEQAEWILVDQCGARSKRMEAVLDAAALVEHAQANQASVEAASNHKNRPHFWIRVPCVLQWSLQVAEYREYGRYVQSVLPAKNPVVVAAAPTNKNNNDKDKATRRPSPSAAAARQAIAALSLATPTESPPPLDPYVRKLIRQQWAQATHLLAMTSAGPPPEHVVTDALDDDEAPQQPQPAPNFSYPRRIETLFRHIEYVITGRHSHHHRDNQNKNEPLSNNDNSESESLHHQSMPPPIDLFDPLLRELATLVW